MIAAGALPLPRPLRWAFIISVSSLVVNLGINVAASVGLPSADSIEFLRSPLMWLLAMPIAVGLMLSGALATRRGQWQVVGVVLCSIGDGVGSMTDSFAVLLTCFLLGQLAFVVSLWPGRRSSLAWGKGAIGYALVALICGSVIAWSAGPLAIPVLLYALALGGMAALAARDTAGLLSGTLFLATGLVLGVAVFAVPIPDPLRSIVVLTGYTAAQLLLSLSLMRELASHARATPRSHYLRQ